MRVKTKSKKNIPLHIYKNVADLMAKASLASRKVLDENKKLGIATPFSLEGRIYHLMPDGRIVLRSGRKRKLGAGRG